MHFHALLGLAGTVGAILLSSLPITANAQAVPSALPDSTAALSRGERPAYAGTYAAARYSPLVQINRENARGLHVAWRWKSPDHAILQANRRISDLSNLDPHLWVYDKATGEMLAEIPLPANATGSPITYMSGGKQFIVFPVGGGPLAEKLIAVAL
ncbi:hypothetical protein FHP25_07285 [Vineibacter terrae]|uniref:Pyrrolo-quinoline quinone repeat domain-containing protein n=1 Tax=Vineibacter terrae TaxID=2586908 RepID=A0A5C8PRQ6_9HYPH|nr:hypothetical protein [Vineibacter terrae]TXL78789.1 hypothetical protein FHP25_07285 [Vineibacter terrae]